MKVAGQRVDCLLDVGCEISRAGSGHKILPKEYQVEHFII
jgi:hypothetical protein